jgi:hypothetical protein
VVVVRCKSRISGANSQSSQFETKIQIRKFFPCGIFYKILIINYLTFWYHVGIFGVKFQIDNMKLLKSLMGGIQKHWFFLVMLAAIALIVILFEML